MGWKVINENIKQQGIPQPDVKNLKMDFGTCVQTSMNLK
jgi:hypothetical protein